jgi:hypothetical protein
MSDSMRDLLRDALPFSTQATIADNRIKTVLSIAA